MAMKTNSLAAAAAKIQGKTNGNLPVKADNKILTPVEVITQFLEDEADDMFRGLPRTMSRQRFMSLTISAITSSPKLMQAYAESKRTLKGAITQCAQLGFEPNSPLRQGFLVPYLTTNRVTGRKEMQCNFQMGYPGVLDLCYRSGEVNMIRPVVIFEKDDWKYEEGLDPILKHVPCRDADRGNPIAYYCVVTMKSGEKGFAFMFYDQVWQHAIDYSKTYNAETKSFSGPWGKQFNAMAKKTVLLQALKYVPKSADFTRKLLMDGTTKSNLADDMSLVQSDDYIDVEAIPLDPDDVKSPPEPPAAKPVAVPIPSRQSAPTPPANRGGAAQSATNGELDLSDIK